MANFGVVVETYNSPFFMEFQMTRDEAVAIVKRGLAFRTTLDDQIIIELKEAQRRSERGHSLPWFLRKENQTLSFTAGNQFATLPTNFLRENEEESPSYFFDNMPQPYFLIKKDWEDAVAAWTYREPGYAQVYVLRNNTFAVFPTPAVDYDITWGYYGKDATLDSGSTENLWLTYCPNLLIGIAGKKLAEDTQNPSAAAHFQAMQLEGFAEIFADGIERDSVNRNYRMGSGL